MRTTAPTPCLGHDIRLGDRFSLPLTAHVDVNVDENGDRLETPLDDRGVELYFTD